MDIREEAGTEFQGHICEVPSCGGDIRYSDAIAFDVDGGYGEDGTELRVRVRHLSCHRGYQAGLHAGILASRDIVRGSPDVDAAVERLAFKARQTFIPSPGVAA